MIYGLYLSATGILTNSYRQDVIANNLANSETVGFKRDLTNFDARRTAAQERNAPASRTDPLMEILGGGVLAAPTAVDTSQGEMEPTESPLDVAIDGKGYFAVDVNGQTRLTRNGRFMIDPQGHLALSNGEDNLVLDTSGKPIKLNGSQSISINRDGSITQNDQVAGRIGIFDVPDPKLLSKEGGTLLDYPDTSQLTKANAVLHSEYIERANVDPAHELAQLMDTQRQIEANATMIRYQDSTLDKLVNDVGKIT